MWGVVRNLVNDGSTILLTTQYLEEADALADEITVIDHGKVIAHDTPTGLKRIVGGQTLTVRPTDPDRLEETTHLIAEIGGPHSPSSRPAGTVAVPVEGDEALDGAVERLNEAGIAVTELGVPCPASTRSSSSAGPSKPPPRRRSYDPP